MDPNAEDWRSKVVTCSLCFRACQVIQEDFYEVRIDTCVDGAGGEV